jgi:hypothetical protein
MKRRLAGRALAVVLSTAMVFTTVPSSVYAEGENAGQGTEMQSAAITPEAQEAEEEGSVVSGTSVSTSEETAAAEETAAISGYLGNFSHNR